MARPVLFLCTLMILTLPKDNTLQRIDTCMIPMFSIYESEQELSAMQALDLVKEHCAVNFEQVKTGQAKDYYYKLPDADYYLAYEGDIENGQEYLIHLYEFVVDDSENGIGHTVTYGWYAVDKITGIITDRTQ